MNNKCRAVYMREVRFLLRRQSKDHAPRCLRPVIMQLLHNNSSSSRIAFLKALGFYFERRDFDFSTSIVLGASGVGNGHDYASIL